MCGKMRPIKSMILLLTVAFVSCADDEFNIELKQKDAEVYHEQNIAKNEFNYGYQVEKTNSQFQHKAKGPDDVTYGCYGYIDPDGEKHLVYYIADRLGYRLLAPDQPTKVFTERVANSVNKLDADLQGRKLDEKVVAWNDLYLPATCRRLNEILTITTPETAPNDGGFLTGSYGPTVVSTTVRPTVGNQYHGRAEDTHKSTVHPVSTEPITQGFPTTAKPTEPTIFHGFEGNGTDDNNGKVTYGTTPHPLQENHTRDPASFPKTKLPQTTYLPVTPTSRPPVVKVPEYLQTPAQPHCGHTDGPFAPRPKYPAQIGQFNGFVFPINRNCDDSGRNTADLLAQMQSINELVLKVSNTLHTLVANDRNGSIVTEGTCQKVLELLNIQQPVPLLVYVPIMLPYLDGGLDGSAGSVSGTQRPPINPASYAYAKTCSECK